MNYYVSHAIKNRERFSVACIALFKGCMATLDAFASCHGMDPFRQFVKLSVNEWSRPYWMRYGYVTVNALRHVTDTSISAKSMCVENRIDASSSSVFCIFLPRTLKSHLVPTLEAWQAVAKALDLKI